MKMIPLFSGSNGNATLIKSGNVKILLDCGVSVPRLVSGLKNHGESLESISAVFLTHSHQDHVKGAQKLVFQKPHLKVYGSGDVERYAMCMNFQKISSGEKIQIGDVEVLPFAVPHDVACFGFTFENEMEKCGYATDMGEVDSEIISHLAGSKTVMIESNYDEYLLQSGRYPAFLKRRIASGHGHLSNLQTKKVCEKLLAKNTQNFILAHLSEQNNTPEIAYSETKSHFDLLGAKLFSDYTLQVAKRFGVEEGDSIVE